MRLPLNTKTALVGGVLAGIGASACCVGPLLLLSLGIGGAWISHLTVLEPFRPFFAGLVLLFLGLALRRLYFLPCCHSEVACDGDHGNKAQRLLFWILAPLLLGLVALPMVLPLFYR